MLKRLTVLFGLWMWFAAAFAAVDVNKATAQELTQIKGIGEATAERIVQERSNGPFRTWEDFIGRVKGVGATKAKSLSEGGLTVGGASYSAPATATTEVKKGTAEKK